MGKAVNCSSTTDGQCMASRLSKAITRESTRLKHLLVEYNSNMMPSEQLTWEDVCNPSAHIWFRFKQPLDLPVPKPVGVAAVNAMMTTKRVRRGSDVTTGDKKRTSLLHERCSCS